VGLALFSLVLPLARVLFVFEILLYLSILTLAGLYAALNQRRPHLIVGLPLSIAVMHISWGSGFLWSILNLSKNKNGR